MGTFSLAHFYLQKWVKNIIDIAKCTAYIGHEKCLAGGDIVVMEHNEDPKYLSYALSTTDEVITRSQFYDRYGLEALSKI
jgi:hypothetical protein